MLSLRFVLPLLLALLTLGILGWLRAVPAEPSVADRARQFLAAHEAKLRPLEIAAGLAWWNANISGKDEDFAKKEEAQNRIDEALADAAAFRTVKDLYQQRAAIGDPILTRAIEVLYLTYLEKQVEPALLKKIVAKANAVEKAFNVFRPKVDGQEMTDSEVRRVLKNSKDSARRQAVWEASKAVGKVVEADLKELVKLRNQAAAQLGFKNYHALMLYLNEQDTDELLKLFDQLDALTREPFSAAKAEIDQKLAADCGVAVADLRPWHYHDPFFQESPAVFAANLDAPYAKADILELCRKFYAGIGLPIDDVLARSDLYEKPGKSPHAFCIDIDRAGDVRVLANIVPNEYWMATMLHELGHAVYSSKNIPATLPYTLRAEAHILTTEGVAMMFERWSKSRAWLTAMGRAVDDPKAFDETAAKMLRNQLLIFSRWCQVMLRFEKSMYEDPGQDLNKLWWDLVERYQQVRRPPGRNAPDYASKIHIVSAPVYYHNYMMGQLFASQLHHAICREVLQGADPRTAVYVGDKRIGEFMIRRVFGPGRSLSWNALTKHATGEELNAKAFAADFRN
ncbi:MAG: M2 family metallopeptidase [Gemmataceae bacterium]|nr:M2 family metallopeptidase [Gemmataceae bacterium]MDW8266783.1 M2 family metallopeptidase [Gemmataceae bacterium]